MEKAKKLLIGFAITAVGMLPLLGIARASAPSAAKDAGAVPAMDAGALSGWDAAIAPAWEGGAALQYDSGMPPASAMDAGRL